MMNDETARLWWNRRLYRAPVAVGRKKRDYERIVLIVFDANAAFLCDNLFTGCYRRTLNAHWHNAIRSHQTRQPPKICMFYLIYFAFHAAFHQSIVTPVLLPSYKRAHEASLFIRHHRQRHHIKSSVFFANKFPVCGWRIACPMWWKTINKNKWDSSESRK